MKFSELKETIGIAYSAIKANKLQSALASLGVVIGISVVIMMGWVLSGLDKAMMDTFNILGTDMLYVDKWTWAGSNHNWKEMRQRKPITLQQAEKFIARLKSAEIAYPSATSYMGSQIKYKKETYNGIPIIGTTSKHASGWGGDVIKGRHFAPNEDRMGGNVVVLGNVVDKSIFPKENSIGKIIKIKGKKYKVIGVLKKQGTALLDFMDNRVYIPLRTFLHSFGRLGRSFTINIKAGNPDKLDEVRAETRGIMRQIRNLGPYDKDDFGINESKAFEEQVSTIRLYVWGVGLGITVLSFLVGMIGIMNIMFVSVTERTREIGIRKAIGAKKASILFQFLVESSTLSFVGAIISLMVCSLIVFAIGTYVPQVWPAGSFLRPYLPLDLFLIASGVSIFVGMLAGIIPAFRAANLNPVDALR